MELLGPNLSDLMKICGGKFSLSTTILLAMQIVFLCLFSLKEFSICMIKVTFIEILNLRIS
jgi:hypothetical protein